MLVCKLCLKQTDLIGKSHIIPRFILKTLNKDKRRMYKYNPNETNPNYRKIHYFQDEYDRKILCQICENDLIGVNETYASSFFKNRFLFPDVSIGSNTHINLKIYSGINYIKFRLFMLSLLWRASISNLAGFKHLSFLTKDETLRKLIVNSNPGNPFEFPVIVDQLDVEAYGYEIITMPEVGVLDSGQHFVELIAGGFLYTFLISTGNVTNIPEIFSELSINETGVLFIRQMTYDATKAKICEYVGISSEWYDYLMVNQLPLHQKIISS